MLSSLHVSPRSLSLLLCLPLLSISAISAISREAAALEVPELAAKMKESVVLLTITDERGQKLGTGSGFFIGPEGRIATNHHVIAGASRAYATLADGRKLDLAGVVADDEAHDLAIVETVEHGPFPTLPLGDESAARVGEEVVVYGSPMGLSGSLSTGVLAAVRESGLPMDDDAKTAPAMPAWAIQITAPISPGSSGSPVAIRSGDVIGVAVGVQTGHAAQNLNFAVPVSSLRKLSDHASKKPVPFGRGERSVGQNLAISAAIIGGIGLVIAALFRFGDRKKPAEQPLESTKKGSTKPS